MRMLRLVPVVLLLSGGCASFSSLDYNGDEYTALFFPSVLTPSVTIMLQNDVPMEGGMFSGASIVGQTAGAAGIVAAAAVMDIDGNDVAVDVDQEQGQKQKQNQKQLQKQKLTKGKKDKDNGPIFKER